MTHGKTSTWTFHDRERGAMERQTTTTSTTWLDTGGVYTVPCVHMKPAKKASATTDVTMREFRAAPAKILRRAARTGTKLRVGEFVLAVEQAIAETGATTLHGAMAGTGHAVGDPGGLLSADDRWSTDG